jgi:hypothetical protein
MDTKTCTKCKEELPVTAFRLIDGKPQAPGTGLAGSWCTSCVNQDRRLRYDRNGRSFQNLFHNTRSSAKQRRIPFALTRADFDKLITGRCAYGDGAYPALRIGVDRKDCSRGYELGNCVPCCARHNEMKKHFFSYSEMLFIVANVESAKACANSRGGRPKLTR